MDRALVGAIVGAAVAGCSRQEPRSSLRLSSGRQSIEDRHKEAHLAASAEALTVLQQLNRELINVARDSSADTRMRVTSSGRTSTRPQSDGTRPATSLLSIARKKRLIY